MRLGIFAKTFVRPDLAATLDAVAACGLDCVQFNFACAGLPTLPDKIQPLTLGLIVNELQRHDFSVAAVSGTFNMIDPDPSKRREGLRRLGEMAASCAVLAAPIITLCTGTRDPQDMWRAHPQNDSSEAWRDLLVSMEEALKIAELNQVCLGIEPETGNVVNSAKKARRLLDEMKSPWLKIVMDAANLFRHGDGRRMAEILDEAFDLLGPDIALAHAKDFLRHKWGGIRIVGMHTTGNGHYKVGENVQVEALVDLPDIKPEDVSVQLYCGPTTAAGEIENPQALVMAHAKQLAPNRHVFTGTIDCRTSGRLPR